MIVPLTSRSLRANASTLGILCTLPVPRFLLIVCNNNVNMLYINSTHSTTHCNNILQSVAGVIHSQYVSCSRLAVSNVHYNAIVGQQVI